MEESAKTLAMQASVVLDTIKALLYAAYYRDATEEFKDSSIEDATSHLKQLIGEVVCNERQLTEAEVGKLFVLVSVIAEINNLDFSALIYKSLKHYDTAGKQTVPQPAF